MERNTIAGQILRRKLPLVRWTRRDIVRLLKRVAKAARTEKKKTPLEHAS